MKVRFKKGSLRHPATPDTLEAYSSMWKRMEGFTGYPTILTVGRGLEIIGHQNRFTSSPIEEIIDRGDYLEVVTKNSKYEFEVISRGEKVPPEYLDPNHCWF